MSAIHPQDQQRIEQLHGAASADIEERMISLQDASYELGRQRGLAEGKTQRDQLLAALQHIEGVAMADEPRDLPGIAETASAAIAKHGRAA